MKLSFSTTTFESNKEEEDSTSTYNPLRMKKAIYFSAMWNNGNGFVQSVFNEISLDKSMALWEDTDVILDPYRVLFLSYMPETLFRKYLRKEQLRKDAQLSSAFREKGNALYKNGDFNASLSVYNQALCLAPKAQDVYPITLANRSAVWHALQRYENAVADIQSSLESSYPKELRFKLLERKAKCQIALRKKKSSEEAIGDFVSCVKESDINVSLKEKKISGIKAEFDKVFENGTKEDEQKEEDSSSSSIQTQPCLNGGPPPPSPTPPLGFCDSVSIGYDPGRGRYTYANRDIDPQLDKEHIKTHCWHCLGRAPLPLPCDNCSGTLKFFLPQVRSLKKKLLQCGITDIIQSGGVGTWILAYRAIASRPLSFWLSRKVMYPRYENDEDTEEEEEEVDVASKISIPEDPFPKTGRFQAPALMKEALTVVFFIRCLNRVGYFPDLSPVERQLGKHLRNFIRIASFNSHEVTEVTLRRNGTEDNVGARRVGTAINPLLALINHSCDPNHGRVWNPASGRIRAFATRSIPKGTEIHDGYSATFSNRGKKERSFVHERYNFTCNCPPCQQDWPLLPQLEKEIKVKPQSTVKKLTSLYKKIETQPSIDNCSAFMKLAGQTLEPPHALLVVVEDKLQRCLLKKYGTS
ncbi:Uncharacterized protein FKW44_009244 [Caligus rogercresseyi]|uniref:SET domain-containing protein n=1 Tax=Caligus rogercresseyi TaxID=217165 RepID=A0A7T8HF09_CALRO|nr:Uncharacterized protein FKW44_009244 [Caligus rogercresseyi]